MVKEVEWTERKMGMFVDKWDLVVGDKLQLGGTVGLGVLSL